jgi:hypothetical protein
VDDVAGEADAALHGSFGVGRGRNYSSSHCRPDDLVFRHDEFGLISGIRKGPLALPLYLEIRRQHSRSLLSFLGELASGISLRSHRQHGEHVFATSLAATGIAPR